MYVSKVIVSRAERIAESIAGKIWSPFCNPVTRLPSRIAGPRRLPIDCANCGSATAYRGETRSAIFFSPVRKFNARTVRARVARAVSAIATNIFPGDFTGEA